MRRFGFILAGLVVCLLLAGVVSMFAADTPDGLEHSAQQGCTVNDDHEVVGGTCIARAEREHGLADTPLADYGWRGVGSEALATGLSGVVGVLVTFAIGGGLFWLLRRRHATTTTDTTTTTTTTGGGG